MNGAAGVAVLIVDDSRLDYLDTRGLLLSTRVDVQRLVWLDRWSGAASALEQGPFTLFLIDLNLGADSGLDVIRDLRAAGVLEPIIALTGQSDESVDRACADAGASDFLVKGRIDRMDLERSIRYARRETEVHLELERLNAALERRAAAEGDQARLMRFAIEQSTDAIFITKAGADLRDHPVVYVNAALTRLLGRRAGDLLGLEVRTLLIDGPTAATSLDQAVGAHIGYSGRIDLRASTGAAAVALRASPLRATDDLVTHYVWTCRAVATETDERSAQRRVVGFEIAGRVAAGFAHELNDRLTAVIGNLELLASRSADDAVRRPAAAALQAAEDIVAQAQRLGALVARDHEPARHEDHVVVDIDALLDRFAPLLQHAVGRLVKVDHRPSSEPSWPVDARATRLELALITLWTWMRDAMPHGGALRSTVDNLGVEALAAEAANGSTPALDRQRDHVRLSLRTVQADGLVPHDAIVASRDDGESRRIEELVRDAGGVLVVEVDDRGDTIAAIYLPRVMAGIVHAA